MTTPGGVPNLPQGALTLDTLASKTQDMTGGAMKSRAVERFPSIMDNSTGLSPASDLTPFGILTSIWAGVISLIANADPADVQGPDDLPDLVIDFIESLPFVGQFVELLEAILGTYDGTDETLLTVSAIFAPIEKLLQLFTGVGSGFPTLTELTDGWDDGLFGDLGTLFGGFSGGSSILSQLIGAIPGTGGSPTGLSGLGDIFTDLTHLLGSPTSLGTGTPALPGITSIPILGGLLTSGNIKTSIIPGLDASKIVTGTFAQSFVTGLPTALTTLTTTTQSVIDNFINGWTGGATTGNPVASVATISAQIKTAVLAGYTVDIFPTSNAAWTIPTGTTEITGIVQNGGNRGNAGGTAVNSLATGGTGGLDGGYLSALLDLTGLTAGTSTLNITVGAAAASVGGTGGVSSIVATTGTLISGTAGSSGISTKEGLLATTSRPGAGGKGGNADTTTATSVATAGDTGTASGLAAGGTAGTSRTTNSSGTAGAGGTGGAGATSAPPFVGGGGGGGGGGCALQVAGGNPTGGAGGNGGFPAAGSGGGGAASSASALGTRTGGAPGTAGNGLVVLIHK